MQNGKNALNENFVKIRDEVKIAGGFNGGNGNGVNLGSEASPVGDIYANKINLLSDQEAGVGAGAVVSQGGIYSFKNIQSAETVIGDRMQVTSEIDADNLLSASVVTEGGLVANKKIRGGTAIIAEQRVLGKSSVDMLYGSAGLRVLNSENETFEDAALADPGIDETVLGTSNLLKVRFDDQDVVEMYTPGFGKKNPKLTLKSTGGITLGDPTLNGPTVMAINSDANVGIGTTNPEQKLHVKNSRLRIESDTLDNAVLELQTGANTAYVFTESDGTLKMYPNDGATHDAQVGPARNIILDANQQLTSTADKVRFGVTGNSVSVGINKSVPDNTLALDVVGNAKIVGDLTVEGSLVSLDETSALRITDVTDSGSVTTGALGSDGGLGVVKNATIGGKLAVATSQLSPGDPNFSAKLYVNGDAFISNNITSSNTTSTTSSVNVQTVTPNGHITYDNNRSTSAVPLRIVINTSLDFTTLSIDDMVNTRYVRQAGGFDIFPASNSTFTTIPGKSSATFEFTFEYVNQTPGSRQIFASVVGGSQPLFRNDFAGDTTSTTNELVVYPFQKAIFRGRCTYTPTSFSTTLFLLTPLSYHIYRNLNTDNAVTVNRSTNNTGSFQHYGGMSVTRNLRVGNAENQTGTLFVDNPVDAETLVDTGCANFAGGVVIKKKVQVGGIFYLPGRNPGDIAMEVTGTAVFGDNVWIGKLPGLPTSPTSVVRIWTLTDSTADNTGALIAEGGCHIKKKLRIGSSSSSQGQLIVNAHPSQPCAIFNGSIDTNFIFNTGGASLNGNNVAQNFGISSAGHTWAANATGRCGWMAGGGTIVSFPADFNDGGEFGDVNLTPEQFLDGFVAWRPNLGIPSLLLPTEIQWNAYFNTLYPNSADRRVRIAKPLHILIRNDTPRSCLIRPQAVFYTRDGRRSSSSVFNVGLSVGTSMIWYVLYGNNGSSVYLEYWLAT